MHIPIDAHYMHIPIDAHCMHIPIDAHYMHILIDAHFMHIPIDAHLIHTPITMHFQTVLQICALLYHRYYNPGIETPHSRPVLGLLQCHNNESVRQFTLHVLITLCEFLTKD